MSDEPCRFCFSSPCQCVRPARNADDMGMPPPANAMSDDTLYQLVVEHVTKWGGDMRDVPMLVALTERLRKENRKIEEG